MHSEKGKGATFEIYLPSSRKSVAESDEIVKSKPIPRGTETILLVEDETAVRELASEFLKAGGYTILEACDGAEAVTIASRHSGRIHLLLTDMVMPHMNGAELASKLCASRPDLRVLYMSGYAEFSGANEGRTPTEASTMQKPFSRLTLLEKVREALSSVTRPLPTGKQA